MNEYERCRRNHPAQRAADQRTLAEMEARIGETAEEPKYGGKGWWPRRKRRGPRFPGPVMRWRY